VLISMPRRSDSEDFNDIVLTLGKGLRNNQCYELQGTSAGAPYIYVPLKNKGFSLIEKTIVRDDIIQRALWMRAPECLELETGPHGMFPRPRDPTYNQSFFIFIFFFFIFIFFSKAPYSQG